MSTSRPSRKLTEIEQAFVKEAEEAYFTVEYTSSGDPFALGADTNTSCFSMVVTEQPDHEGGATYFIK